MRYYNENPQVTYLLEKVEEQEEKLKFSYDYNQILVSGYNKMSEQIELFNSLPWYKKMFYKFKL